MFEDDSKFNKLCFNVNLREGDIDCLISSLRRLRQAELFAERQGIHTERSLDDYERVITLLVASAELSSLMPEIKALNITPTTFAACDLAALSMAEELGFSV